MLTNFHLPQSSLLMLVCALAGRELVLAAYQHAVEAGYRFYSYGDCMLIVNLTGTDERPDDQRYRCGSRWRGAGPGSPGRLSEGQDRRWRAV